ncbi:2389_t:CDS:2 [Rhizophagus irregularis]|uniref:Uncharacterized protein n=1 Tax=Rhizophagus irregularis (strain DAOM 181602 / DAOM 197198 / MUCL 43194) TaxID=747089 RepID=U9T4I8_RHIID|nr:2389_t:CDS:2 [Rhizophagus irregularis]
MFVVAGDKTFKFGEWTVKKVYRMFLLGAFRFPISWEDHHELLHALPILWNFGPIGKKARNINPMKREEFEDPSSPSPMPKKNLFNSQTK